jgi:protein-tyrosine phosphatase
MPEIDTFMTALREVMTWEGSVYVHCANGVGRSASFAACLMIMRGHATSIDDAFTQMKAVRYVNIQPNQRAMLDALPLNSGNTAQDEDTKSMTDGLLSIG